MASIRHPCFIQASALTTIYRKGVASLGSSATRWTVSVAYPTSPLLGFLSVRLVKCLSNFSTGL